MSLKLSLGAIQYYWPKQTVFAWYDRIADTDADIIYLGETVCARRHELRLADWLAIADNLAASGKEILLASQTLLESESDLKRLRKIAKQERYPIEANDMGAVKLARDHGHPFVAGSSLNLYNEHTLALVRRLGAYRWQPPAELSRDKLATLLAASADPGETELFAWGKIPLAYSSRCFTARHYNLNKDNCQFRCLEHPHGMSMDTREKTPFLTINGIQTMSHGSQCLLAHHADIAALGVGILRLSPQLEHMAEIISLHRQTLDGTLTTADALRELAPLALGALVDGYWHGNPGIEKIKTYYSEANAGPIYQPPTSPLPPWDWNSSAKGRERDGVGASGAAIPVSTDGVVAGVTQASIHAESPAARPLPCVAGEGRGGGVNTPRSDNANPPRAENQNPLPSTNLPPPPQDAQRSQRDWNSSSEGRERAGVGVASMKLPPMQTRPLRNGVPFSTSPDSQNPAPSTPTRLLAKLRPTQPLPGWLARIGRHLPTLPPRLILVQTLNQMLRRGLLPADMTQFAGRHFQLDVLDLGISIRFSADTQRFTAENYPGAPDLRLAANSADYLRMILREEDPDTLFFNRKLQIEGDTALGLATKNLLDCVDWRWQRLLPQRLTVWLQTRGHRWHPGAA